MSLPGPTPDYPDPRLAPWPGFALAAQAAVQHLADHFGLDLWLVTAVQDDDQVIVASAGPWSEFATPGTVFPWQESFCQEMTSQRGPTVACDVRDFPAYAARAVGVLAQVQAYVGVPLAGDGDEVFGTLCAFAGQPQPASMGDSLPSVQLVGQMLSTVLAREQFAQARSHEAAAAQALAGEDALTGLRNRRGWEVALEHEHQRSQRYSSTPSVVVVEVDGQGSGDDLLCRCADALKSGVRPGDVVARLGGGEFGVLAVECDPAAARALVVRLRVQLRNELVPAGVGAATRRTGEDLLGTWRRAQAEAQRDRRRRPRPRSASGGVGRLS